MAMHFCQNEKTDEESNHQSATKPDAPPFPLESRSPFGRRFLRRTAILVWPR